LLIDSYLLLAPSIRYFISVTVICDINKKFISSLARFPGSSHDACVVLHMQVAHKPEEYFNQKQFLLADSAYTNDRYVVPAFKGKHFLKHQNINFNYFLAQS
jgi:hypothetical protein